MDKTKKKVAAIPPNDRKQATTTATKKGAINPSTKQKHHGTTTTTNFPTEAKGKKPKQFYSTGFKPVVSAKATPNRHHDSTIPKIVVRETKHSNHSNAVWTMRELDEALRVGDLAVSDVSSDGEGGLIRKRTDKPTASPAPRRKRSCSLSAMPSRAINPQQRRHLSSKAGSSTSVSSVGSAVSGCSRGRSQTLALNQPATAMERKLAVKRAQHYRSFDTRLDSAHDRAEGEEKGDEGKEKAKKYEELGFFKQLIYELKR